MESLDNKDIKDMSNEELKRAKEIFKSEWSEGFYDEWIFVYNPKLKLLLITYAHGDFEGIYERLVSDEGKEIFTTNAEKIARNVKKNEVAFAVRAIVSKDDDYYFVNIDWSNKKDVKSFIHS